jgi:protoheme IX farnesyltransferase
MVLLNSLALVGISLLLTLTGVTGLMYAAGALVVGGGLTALSWRLYRKMSDRRARQVFIASIIYLTVVMVLVMVDMA